MYRKTGEDIPATLFQGGKIILAQNVGTDISWNIRIDKKHGKSYKY